MKHSTSKTSGVVNNNMFLELPFKLTCSHSYSHKWGDVQLVQPTWIHMMTMGKGETPCCIMGKHAAFAA